MKNYSLLFALSLFILLGCNEGKETAKVKDENQSTSIENIEINALDIATQAEHIQELETIEIAVVHTNENASEENITKEEVVEEVVEEEVVEKKDISENKAVSKEWYIRLVIEDLSNNLKTASTQLGQVDSSRAIEDFNLKALKPFGSSYVDVVFKNPLGMKAGEYKSDFHLVDNTVDSWSFTVKSHDINAMMVLGYKGLFVLSPYMDSEDRERYTEVRMPTHTLLAQMVLVDIAENKEIAVMSNSKMNAYLFSMNGQKEKHFRWELRSLSVEVKTLRARLNTNRLEIKALRMDSRLNTRKNIKGNFSILPPKFEVLVK